MTTVTLRLTTHPVHAVPQTHVVTLPEGAETVASLKQHLSLTWDGQPEPKGIVCVLGGRVLRDAELVSDVIAQRENPVIHVIVRASAWTKPFTPSIAITAPSETPAPAPTPAPSTPPPVSTIPDPSPFVSPETDPATKIMNQFTTYLTFLTQLAPLQRSLLLLNLQKAHHFYSSQIQLRLCLLGFAPPIPLSPKKEEESDEEFIKRVESDREVKELDQVVGLLKDCQLWNEVIEKEQEAENQVNNWNDLKPEGEFQIVQISGLPFVLQLPTNFTSKTPAPSIESYQSLRRAQSILHLLTTMLQLLLTYQPRTPLRPPNPFPFNASVTSSQRHQLDAAIGLEDELNRIGAGVGAQQNRAGRRLPNPIPIPIAGAPRRHTLSIVINLEAILSIAIPLFLLSVKLAFLFWIFGRNASFHKKLILGAIATLWVFYEGWGLYRRRVARDRLRPAVGPAAAAGVGGGQARRDDLRRRVLGGAQGIIPPLPAGGGGAGEEGGRRRRSNRAPISRLSPKYWLNFIAAIGLADEARELGLTPRSIAGRPVNNPPLRPGNNAGGMGMGERGEERRLNRLRAFRTAFVAIVLFFGTLSPEVERKRKRALVKRERLLDARATRNERVNIPISGGEEGNRPIAAGSGASTPAVFEAAEPIPDLIPAPTPTPPTSTPTESESNPTSSTSTASANPTNNENEIQVGRNNISDAELFADGLEEPDQDMSMVREMEEEEEVIAQGRIDDNETDDENDPDGEGGDGGQGERRDGLGNALEEGQDVDQIVALF